MAYRLSYWKADGAGQAELKGVVLKSVEEAFPLSLPHNHPKGTVLVTMNRTDHQSVHEKVLWQDPAYIDPCS